MYFAIQLRPALTAVLSRYVFKFEIYLFHGAQTSDCAALKKCKGRECRCEQDACEYKKIHYPPPPSSWTSIFNMYRVRSLCKPVCWEINFFYSKDQDARLTGHLNIYYPQMAVQRNKRLREQGTLLPHKPSTHLRVNMTTIYMMVECLTHSVCLHVTKNLTFVLALYV